MKRRYKAGDWYRIPLDGADDALVLITRACRSRLFGYFFAARPDCAADASVLRALTKDDAVYRSLFGADGIEDRRWPLLAASLAFEPARWEFPEFAAADSFGRHHYRCTFDDELRLTSRAPVQASGVAGLPPARFADAIDIERVLRARLTDAFDDGRSARETIYEMKAAPDADAIEFLKNGGTVQFCRPLPPQALHALARALGAAALALRVHGNVVADIAELQPLRRIRSLALECRGVRNCAQLQSFDALQTITLGAGALAALEAACGLSSLRRLRVSGRGIDTHVVANAAALYELELIAAPDADLHALRAAPIRSLRLAHAPYDVAALRGASIESLALHDTALASLEALALLPRLRALSLSNVRLLRDLAPLAAMPTLRELRISGMAQLQVRDFEPLRGIGERVRVSVDVQSRKKNREVYRMLAEGTSRV